ncbi:MAG: tyrosine-type recombinase/integrase [SAR324 cluster bacterium]|nr:tyrosine-type recombinase/integrase [SAR324 cluster bacterium]
MPREKQNFESDEQRQIIRGRFHRILTESGRPLIRDLCSFDELAFKTTSTGRKKRTEAEQQNYLNTLYEQKLYQLEVEQKEEQTKKNETVMVKDVMQKYLDHVEKFKSPKTLKLYSKSLSRYIEAVGDHDIGIFRPHYQDDLKGLLDKLKLADTTQNSVFREIQAFWNWAFHQKYISIPVRLEKPKVTRREPDIFQVDEMATMEAMLLSQIQTAPSHRKKAYENHLRIFQLARYAGLRRGEIWSLRLDNIIVKQRVIRLRDCPELGWFIKDREEAFIPMSEKLALFIETDLSGRGSSERWYLDDGHGQNFYQDVDYLTRAFTRIKKKAGITSRVKPLHGHRATVATSLLQGGEDVTIVQALMRHSDIATTKKHYLNSKGLPLKGAVDKL